MSSWLEALNRLEGSIAGVSPFTISLFPFHGRLGNLRLVTAFRHSWVDAWRKAGIPVFCLEETEADPPGSAAGLLRRPAVIRWLKSLPAPVRLLMFKPTREVEVACATHGFELLHPPAGVARRLENKLNLPDIAAAAGVPAIPWTLARLGGATPPEALLARGSPPLILQLSKGFSGNRTFVIRAESEMRRLEERFPGRRCRIAEMLPGETWTINGVISRDGVVAVYAPFCQITREIPGADGLPPTLGSRGNIWISPPGTPSRSLRKWMARLGGELYRRGFYGVFGADFLLDERKSPLLVEINPRPVASLPALAQLETGGVPEIARHILWLAGAPPVETSPCALPEGGQLILRKDGLQYAVKISGTMLSGEYHLTEDHRLTFVRPATSASDIDENNCLVWMPERAVPPGREVARIITPSPRLLSRLIRMMFPE